MKILAFDLVWNGHTGWVYWDDSKKDPIVSFGQFKATAPTKSTGAHREQDLCRSISNHTWEICNAYTGDRDRSVVWAVFEETDWFQNLEIIHNAEERRKKYAQERKVQRTLGMAKAAFLMAVDKLRMPVYGIGAREVKEEFGALRKDAAARLLTEEFSRFSAKEVGDTSGLSPDKLFGSERDGYFMVFDSVTNDYIEHHVSDAIIAAKVVSARLNRDEKIQGSLK